MFPFKGSGSKRDNNGIGYAGDARGDAAKRKKLQKQAHANEDHETKIQESTLRSALQSFSSQSSATATMHRLPNEWLNTLKSVLRNQANWSSDKKCSLYQLALDCCENVLHQSPKQLGDEDDSESLIVALLEMASTAQVVANHSQDYSRKVQQLAHQVLNLKDRALQTSRAVVEKEDLLVVDNHDHYRQALRPYAFDFVDRLQGHCFEKQPIASASQSTVQRQKILRELGTYKTALPVEYGSSVFVRAVENRMDLLRCLVIGPEDSPYENGCFFFDIHLSGYPNSPPKVKFLTTGGGKYRFNPNLYCDGKVCLSLLGTWSGPGWQSGESSCKSFNRFSTLVLVGFTLKFSSKVLQVLVSIQSLILVEQPYFNEPGMHRGLYLDTYRNPGIGVPYLTGMIPQIVISGFQASEGTPHGTQESNRYNESIRRYTLDAAILPHLRRLAGVTTSAYPEFDAIIEKHFELKEHALKMQLSKWRNDKTPEPSHMKYPFYATMHHTKTCCPSMETLYIACVSAIDNWPRKKKARKSKNSATKVSLPLSYGHGNQVVQLIRAVEVNGVIEIDLDDDSQDQVAITNVLRPKSSVPKNAIVSHPPVDSSSRVTSAPSEVIDLT